MTEAPAPETLKYAAFTQIISGIVNIFVVSWGMFLFWQVAGGVFGSFLTILCASVGCPCGLLGYLPMCFSISGLFVVPLGILEILAGAMGLANPRSGVTMMRVVAIAEMLSLFIGALPAVLAGGVTLVFLQSPQVRGYLGS
jgi:hypothetical protein